MRIKGNVAEATYHVSPGVDPASVVDGFRASLRSRGLEMYGKPVIEVQRELFEHGDNVRVAGFVGKLR